MIAKFRSTGLTGKPFESVFKELEVGSRHPLFDCYPGRCVPGGGGTVVGYFDAGPVAAAHCSECRACIDACPTGALVVRTAAEA